MKKHNRNTRHAALLAVLFAVVCVVAPASDAQTDGPQVLKNPYATVDWDNVNQYTANFHSHTVYSDGRAEPEELIHNYANAGYHILAIADHDNHHTTREEERETVPTHATTWPWTNWISEEPSRVWHQAGRETSAFFPDLGEQGMLAVRANELSTHPHLVSLFNDCGFPDRNQDDDTRMACIAERGGLGYWAHPANYVPEGGWEDRFFDSSWEEAVDYYGRYIAEHDCLLGFEMQMGRRLALEEEFIDRMLGQYYRDHDVFFMGSDDTHSTSVADDAVLTVVLAAELTEEAVRHALENGHKFVGNRTQTQPRFNRIAVDPAARTITVDVAQHDGITWFRDGEVFAEGETVDYSDMEDTVLRFTVSAGDAVFYSQGFYID